MPEENVPLDGISSPEDQTSTQQALVAPAPTQAPTLQDKVDAVSPEVRARLKRMLAVFIGVPYILFLLWCFFLMAVLPSATGEFENLILPGMATSAMFAVVLISLGLVAVKRVYERKDLHESVRTKGLVRIAILCIPGILISAWTPVYISGEPRLSLEIVNPPSEVEKVAPLSIEFSAEAATAILRRRGLRVLQYQWDFDGDKLANQTTSDPIATAIYDRSGIYNMAVVLTLNDKSRRVIPYRLIIPRATFALDPTKVIVDEPIEFSVGHLFDLPEEVRQVEWDFDGDGEYEEVSTNLSTIHEFERVGQTRVAAKLTLASQVIMQLEKTFVVNETPPLPFDIKILTKPENLFSPSPFGVVFKVETEEELESIKWDFGDDTNEGSGSPVKHTFRRQGDLTVTMTARSTSGEKAKVTQLVRIVPPLVLSDLVFNGSPEVSLSSRRIEGEVPLKLDLTPRTAEQPFIEFFWEAPDATVVSSTDTTLNAIYRRAGNYTITLVAQDPEGRAMRMPIDVIVKPPSKNVSIQMVPEGGVAPLDVRFDASETSIPGEDISGFEWIFGDEPEPIAQQGGAVMTHKYEQPGTYQVQLFTRTTKGNIYTQDKTIVVRAPLLNACFEASRLSGPAPLGVIFDMSCTTGIPAEIEWDFGDGTKSEQTSPQHVFEEASSYQVTLKITDVTGKVSKKTVEITAYDATQ